MEITINIKAPELAHALETLAIAIGCTVDKIGVGEAIEEAVNQGPVNEKTEKPEKPEKVTPDQELVEADEAIDDSVTVTIEQVREAFMAKNSKSNTTKLKAILKKFKVAKVTDLPEENFSEVLKELEAL